jgi:membrane-bound serine protease (ClpP class)
MTGAWLLILLGLALLFVEVVLPSGMLLVISLAALATGVMLIFFASPEEGGGATTGFLALTILLVLIPIILGAAFYYLPRNPIGKQLFLPERPIEEVEAPMTDNVALEQLLGQIGKTATELRPSGVTLIQGHRVDTKTEGIYVEAGQWVRVTDVRGGQITVRPLAADELRDLPDDLNA